MQSGARQYPYTTCSMQQLLMHGHPVAHGHRRLTAIVHELDNFAFQSDQSVVHRTGQPAGCVPVVGWNVEQLVVVKVDAIKRCCRPHISDLALADPRVLDPAF